GGIHRLQYGRGVFSCSARRSGGLRTIAGPASVNRMFSFFKRKKPAQDALDEVIAAPEAPPDEARLAQALASMQAAADAPPSAEAATEPDGAAEAAAEPIQPPDAWSDRPDVAAPADAPAEAGSW